jgi:opacity protein-like surface antigen
MWKFMKHFIVILSLAFGCLFTNTSFADPYIGIIGGGTAGFDLQHSRFDTSTGYYIGGRIGFNCLSLLRLEEEISYQRSAVHSISKKGFNLNHVHGHISFWSFMTNLIVDLDCPFIISPYFGAGIGYARGDGNGKGRFSFEESSHAKENIHCNAFAWQALFGLKYCICYGLETSLEYRYFKINDVDANHKFGLALTKFF